MTIVVPTNSRYHQLSTYPYNKLIYIRTCYYASVGNGTVVSQNHLLNTFKNEMSI